MNSTQLHRLLLDNLNTAVLLLDADLSINYVNSAVESLLQVSSVRLIGSNVCELFSDEESSKENLLEALKNNVGHTRRHEYLRVLASMDLFQVDYTVTPVEINLERMLLMEMQPIDRFLKINREEALLSVHDTSKSLIRGLAHEIKNPLGGIRGAAQLLDQEIVDIGLDDEARELCKIITTETDRLRNLVDRLLGPNELPQLEQINVHEVTEHVAVLLEAEAQGTLVISRDYDPSIPDIQGDRIQLIQAVLNVARNAMQAVIESNLSTPLVTIKSRIQRSFTIGGDRHRVVCRIDVIDNGPGVSAEIFERIFFPMISGRSNGSGLGLTIAQTAINGHQGIIECDSEPGNTRFSIYLPIRD
ncbi:MAG: PAS domain-containing protein [Porticoccaceae bacterium]|nr:PAS domain-containing protein [Porticoccaceae bacterium]MBT5003978.1 PAS domain-containing protein [Porticoccaceae bacterium]MBT7167439.1 PAS domain-containing protein [Porticoccaceae bacterium]MBT7565466.1 PAS domain-containing protein [Porticoccaceae bacterium]MBT7963142.1 PAS domain-containing protein [Porticoccaceae bacterium]